ncbi:MAG: hypothetical protein ACR2PO_04000 [Methyloligellaceae bacterium]
MNNFALNAIALLLIAFFLGCVAGCLLRRVFGRETAPAETNTTALKERAVNAMSEPEPQPEPQVAEAAPSPAAATGAPAVHETAGSDAGSAAAASTSQPDDLKRIKGVGPVIEKKLNEMGVERFEQIANWTRADVEKVDGELKFRGRIDREDWISQAKSLAAGE